MSKGNSWYGRTGEGLTRQMPDRCPQLASRPGWHGPCHRGHSRCVRAAKRSEAIRRNALPDGQ